uniref:Uncharacterized protein n=1 Tax=Rhizophora mucronata TaxID=61149 RepID=A0A2P2PNC6_RHIMU
MEFGSFTSYKLASFSFSSAFETLGLPGCRTSITNCFLESSLLVMNFLVLIVTALSAIVLIC